jgi:hypothetical protein
LQWFDSMICLSLIRTSGWKIGVNEYVHYLHHTYKYRHVVVVIFIPRRVAASFSSFDVDCKTIAQQKFENYLTLIRLTKDLKNQRLKHRTAGSRLEHLQPN